MLKTVWREENPPTLWECKLVQPHGEQYGGSLKKLKIEELPFDSAVPLLGTYPEETMV